MSPSNNDDASGATNHDGARPLTRKELRALEKHTEDTSAVPEQAYQTGQDVPLPAQAPEAFEAPAADPVAPVVVPPAPEREPDATAEPVVEPAEPVQPVAEPVHAGEPVVPRQPDTRPSIQEAAHTEVQHQVPATVPDYHTDNHQAVDAEDAEHYEGHPTGYAHPDEVHHYDDQHYEGHHYDEQDLHGHYVEDPQAAHPQDHTDAGLLAGAAGSSVVTKPSKKVRRRRRLLALFLTLVVFVAALAVGAQFLKPLLGSGKASDYPGPGTGEVQVSVQSGEGMRSVAAKLETGKVIANADTFLQAFAASGGTLTPGDFTFKSEMKNSDAVNVLLGHDKTKVIYFALSAGLRIDESLQAISEGSGIKVQQLKQFSDSPQQFGLPANAKNLEGFLHPGEYRFPLGTPAKDILQALVKTTTDELVAQGITDPAKQYEAIIVASIVQAEGGQAEYGDVAGAIYNRLKPNDQTGGFLQVDSAVTYGLGTRSFNFTDEQRQDKSNAYNTYANPGLPPGPIGSPGKTAIDAAAKPKTNDFLYWVTINLDTKETKFSKTLAEHNGYVEQYNTWCRANTGRCA
ncbi:endolytic transglycosylase MltG [Pseudarthrobacter sulfonivorans]|uniref:endolytic transglycosylase MltG n=1 Tax=Pseudarthrobacter sulfonivorans TaxID=121292 RepID=UPI00168B3AEA|nr:endolytic transglycosylase MltG [Pseudarthrobacter sulfonivorans]